LSATIPLGQFACHVIATRLPLSHCSWSPKAASNPIAKLPGLPVHHRYGLSSSWMLLCAVCIFKGSSACSFMHDVFGVDAGTL
jgi:hypothetical protein